MKTIIQIKLLNFKRFTSFEVDLNDGINVFIGDNEAGKSTILLAVDLVLSGSKAKVETIGLEALFSKITIESFFKSQRRFEDLPSLYVEVYLSDQNNPDLNGKNNSKEILCDGLTLLCEPDLDFSKNIKEILNSDFNNFPFEYYKIRFQTFSGDGFTNYKKYINHIFLDSSLINNEYATRDYIKTIFDSHTNEIEKNKFQFEYRSSKEKFKSEILSELNDKLEDYSFTLKTGSKENLQSDLTLSENGIPIQNRGKGRQCFIKTEFALKKKASKKGIDLILLEEPENHLSHVQMTKLIKRIQESVNKQIFIATHSNLVSSRLNLRKAVLLNSSGISQVQLKNIPKDTAKFFIKAPDNNILDFILANKVVLVEGDAEYILFEAFLKKLPEAHVADNEFHVLSIGGTSFKRYLDVALILGIKVAVIRDNDGKPNENCIESFQDYKSENIKIFYDTDKDRSTFEICLYQDNTEICDRTFSEGRRSLTIQEYMLSNKTEAAYQLLLKEADNLNTPSYIEEAISWIRN